MHSVLRAQVLDVLLGAGLNRPGVGGGSGVPPSSATTTMRNWPRRHAWIARKRRPLAWVTTVGRWRADIRAAVSASTQPVHAGTSAVLVVLAIATGSR